MNKTSVGRILEELEEKRKLKNYAPRTLHNYFVKLITKDAKDKEEKENIKKQHKNKMGHYEVDIFLKPYLSAVFQGYDKGLVFYKKIIQDLDGNTEEITFEEIKEAFEEAIQVFSEECKDQDHIQQMVIEYDEFTGLSVNIAVENISRCMDAIVANTYGLSYFDRVGILKNVESFFNKDIFLSATLSTVANSLYDELEKMEMKSNNSL
ncbi:hypothetical protein [Bacillus cereus]|uniref:hypothetical protein n=1 Tax=Bacillus cereus TaxID=1396 RepID=UPI002894CF07|nr:hypothetical protein [Bacillus toyonensis]